MATDTIPAPASSTSAPIATNGEVRPPVSGRLPPAAVAADDAVLLEVAVAVAVAVVLAVAVEPAVAFALALPVHNCFRRAHPSSGVISPFSTIPAVSPRTTGCGLALALADEPVYTARTCAALCSALATGANISATSMDSPTNRSSFLKVSSFRLCVPRGVPVPLPSPSTSTFCAPGLTHRIKATCATQYPYKKNTEFLE
jgi:hypothetical protein